ncbi:MAG: GNAT family N-acetyltransferase [Planctomycetales bacterium]|nr:GNAT family N-acetyltransferase [Planctomycetales bacterium]
MTMHSPGDLNPVASPDESITVRRVGIPSAEYNWFFHDVIGSKYNWGGRHGWQLEDWQAFVDRADLETWVAYWSDAPAGYFEIETQTDGSQRVHCFGLLEPFIGRRLGGYLLTRCVQRCWERDATRIWLRTCTYDHPHALANYKARGFVLTNTTCADL